MAAVFCLFVVVRVAVDVVEDDHIGRCEVDALAPGTGGQQEHEDFRVIVEVINEANPTAEGIKQT